MSTVRRLAVPRRPRHQEVHRDDGASEPDKPALRGLCRGDRALERNEEPPLGAHLVTPRFGYLHHGIHVGAGVVVHYGAFANRWQRGPVEAVSLPRFAHGHPVWIRPAGPQGLQRDEIVRRAMSRLGEDRYRLFTNNCEHFTEWCVRGEHRSGQIERLLERLRCIPRALSKLRRSLESSPLRHWSAAVLPERCVRVLPAYSPAAAARSPWPVTSVAGRFPSDGRHPADLLEVRLRTNRQGSV
jgi:hypothetical protein